MPFGIKPAAEEYHCNQQDELVGLKGISIIVDDILVYRCGETMKKAISDHIHNLTNRLEKGLGSQPKTQQTEEETATHRGTTHGTNAGLTRSVTRSRKGESNTANAQTFKHEWLQRLLGFLNYLIKFLPCSEVCEPLRHLLETCPM